LNKLIYNFKAFVQPSKAGKTVDGKTFDCVRDLGFRQFQNQRFQLQNVDLPDTTKAEATDETRARWDSARDCLTIALLGEKPLGEAPLPPGFQGRSCIIAPLKPTKYGRAVVRVYLQTLRGNVLYENLSVQLAGFSFLDVNKFMYHMGPHGFDLEHARTVIDSFEITDVTVA
jgi:hypothetical protein